MSLFLRNFVRRWWWLLLVQFVASSLFWAYNNRSGGGLAGRRGPALDHFEFAVAVAMSWDLARGLNRACLSWPLTRAALARGLWLAVAGIGPLISCLAMVPRLLYCAVAGASPPSSSEMSLHAALSLLMGGSLQFVLSGLPARPSPSVRGKIRDGVFGLLWGISLSTPGWLGLVMPRRWEDLQAGGAAALVLMAAVTAASWFTTAGMILGRAAPAASGAAGRQRSAAGAPDGNPEGKEDGPRAPRGPGGWRVWLALELRWLLALPLMALLILGSLRLMGSLSTGGSRAAIESAPTHYASLGGLCTMMVIPLFSLSCGSVRAFAALPVRRGAQALLMALRPPVYSLAMFAAYVLLAWLTGGPVLYPGIAVCVFTLIGSLTSLLQPVLIRWPSFPALLGMSMVLTPAAILLIPYSFKGNLPLMWMIQFSLAFILISAVLHRRALRGSSKIYRNLPWLQRQAMTGAGR